LKKIIALIKIPFLAIRFLWILVRTTLVYGISGKTAYKIASGTEISKYCPKCQRVYIGKMKFYCQDCRKSKLILI